MHRWCPVMLNALSKSFTCSLILILILILPHRNTEIQKYICHQAFTQSIQSTSRGTPHTSTRTVQDSPPPQRRSALRTIVIIVIILCTHAQQGHQTSGSCSQHIHQGAGAQHGATRGHHSRSRGGA